MKLSVENKMNVACINIISEQLNFFFYNCIIAENYDFWVNIQLTASVLRMKIHCMWRKFLRPF